MKLVRLAKESRKNPVAEVGLSIASTSTHEQDPDVTVLGLPNLNVTEDEEMPSESERESSSLMLAQTQSSDSSPEDSNDSDNEYEFSSDDAQTILKEWISQQPTETLHMQGIMLMDALLHTVRTKRKAAEITSSYTGISERSIRKWHQDFYRLQGELVNDGRGQWERIGLIKNEKVHAKAIEWLRMHTGKRNCTINIASFQKFINMVLLPTFASRIPVTVGSPHSISAMSTWRLMKIAGFEYSKISKGYVDGHERADVVTDRNNFLHMMQELENSHKPPPTPVDGIHPYPLGNPDADKYLVLIYHDESTFHSNEGVSYSWHEKGNYPLRTKDQGIGIMVTDFWMNSMAFYSSHNLR